MHGDTPMNSHNSGASEANEEEKAGSGSDNGNANLLINQNEKILF